MDAPERTLVIEVKCEHCKRKPLRGRAGDILIEMKPGLDGLRWYLCPTCWFEGLHPNENRSLGQSSNRVLVTGPPVATPSPMVDSGSPAVATTSAWVADAPAKPSRKRAKA